VVQQSRLITDGVPAWGMAKPLADEAIGQDPHRLPRGFHAVVSSRAAVVVPDPQLRRRGHLPSPQNIGSCWRKLNPGRHALLVLAYLRKGETFADLAAGFGIGTATAWRYVTETVALLACRAHDLTAARIWGIIRQLAAAGLIMLAGKGYHGAGDPIRTPYRATPPQNPSDRAPSSDLA
jgi:hypothetical protein